MSHPVRPRLLHISGDGSFRCIQGELFRQKLAEIGELVLLDGRGMDEADIARQVRDCDVYLAGWASVGLPASLAADPGRLRYVCGITGSMRGMVPVELVDAGIPLTNWGDAPAWDVAEGAMTLLLASVKSLHFRINWQRDGHYWNLPAHAGGTLLEMTVGCLGCGVIGRRFIELLRPFGAVIRVFDPYLEAVPDGCERVNTLRELFERSEAIVIHAGLTDETRGSVTGELLALLPDGGIVVNTARGGIVDQDALFAELMRGRLKAGLDVLEPDHLAADHPVRQLPNVILTTHAIAGGGTGGRGRPRLNRMQRYCLENLRRFGAGEPLQWGMDPVRYRRST